MNVLKNLFKRTPLGVDYDPDTNSATITYQSLPGEAFLVKGSPDLERALP